VSRKRRLKQKEKAHSHQAHNLDTVTALFRRDYRGARISEHGEGKGKRRETNNKEKDVLAEDAPKKKKESETGRREIFQTTSCLDGALCWRGFQEKASAEAKRKRYKKCVKKSLSLKKALLRRAVAVPRSSVCWRKKLKRTGRSQGAPGEYKASLKGKG